MQGESWEDLECSGSVGPGDSHRASWEVRKMVQNGKQVGLSDIKKRGKIPSRWPRSQCSFELPCI